MKRRAHPGLLYDEVQIERLKQNIAQNAAIREAWSRHLREADNLLAQDLVPEADADAVDSQHGNYGRPSNQISRMALLLGLAYQVTREGRYAQKLREALLHYSGYQKWFGKGLLRNDPPWHSELNTARFCFGFALGYDAIYDTLSADERAEIVGAVTRLGILPILDDWLLPERRVHALDSMGHNWWSVCVSQAGLAALAVMDEEPRAKAWAESAVHGLEEWFAYKGSSLLNKSPNFDDSGAFYESVNYANYALYEYLLFRLAYTRAFGENSVPRNALLEQAGDYFLHTCYPTSEGLLTVNFGDGHLFGHAGKAVLMLLANGYQDPGLRWYLERTDEASSPLALLYADGHPAERPKHLKRSVMYPEIGWAVMRSSWEDDATLLAVKSGFTWNHAHADAGSYVLFHAGKPLIIDSGTCSYGRPEYQEYYVQSHAHNVILFNGEGQMSEDLYRGGKHPGSVHHLIEDGDFRYLLADATGPMSRFLSRNYRHFLWLDRVLIIIDDVRAHEAGTIEWLLHFDGEAIHRDGAVHLVNGPARALVQPIFPEHITISQREGLADHDPDRKVPYLSFAAPEKTREAKFITAITLLDQDSDTEKPVIEPMIGAEMLGVRVLSQDKQTDIYLNLRADGRRMHRNSNHTMDGWETDAIVVAMTRPSGADAAAPDSLEHTFIGGGSYLRRDGTVLFDSLSKAFASWRTTGSERLVILQGQPRMNAELRVGDEPERIICNGKTAPFTYNKSRKSVRLAVY